MRIKVKVGHVYSSGKYVRPRSQFRHVLRCVDGIHRPDTSYSEPSERLGDREVGGHEIPTFLHPN